MVERYYPQFGPLVPMVGRRDILLRRGVSERIAVLWETRNPNGSFSPRELPEGTPRLTLMSYDEDVWLQKSGFMNADEGTVLANIFPNEINTPEWEARQSGRWKIDIEGERVADGYFTLEI